MLVYRINFANPAADRFSRLALWQVHKTKAELDAAFRPLAIGEFSDMRVIQRGLSERLVSTEIVGTTGRAHRPRAAASHAAVIARQPVLVRHRAQRGRHRRRRDVLRPRLGAWRRHVPGGRLRHGAGGSDVRGDPEEVPTAALRCRNCIEHRDLGGFAPPDPPTRSLAGAPYAPLRSRGSLATARSLPTGSRRSAGLERRAQGPASTATRTARLSDRSEVPVAPVKRCIHEGVNRG